MSESDTQLHGGHPAPRLILDHRYPPLLCAAPEGGLPPNVCWRITSGGYLYGMYRRIGDLLDLSDVHEREAVDVCGGDWGDEPAPMRVRAG